MPTTITLDSAELATVLAALRFWQEEEMANDPFKRSDALQDIATNGDEETSLDNAGVDALCERLNCGEG
jgi:hypothetical protein